MQTRARGPKPQKIYKKKDAVPTPLLYNLSLESDEDWLLLLSSGLEEVHAVSASMEHTQERTVFAILESIGLIPFLTDVWRWQTVNVCQAFVLHWDHKSKTTEVHGVHIDAGYRNFFSVTSLGSGEKDALGSSNEVMKGGQSIGNKKRGMDYVEDMEWKSISFLLHNDPIIESLLRLLYKTLWFSKKPWHCPSVDQVYFLIQSMRGEELDWSKSVYEKFINEIRKLQDRHDNDPDEKLSTLAGPLMCFLYSQAKQRAEGGKENVRCPDNRDEKHHGPDQTPYEHCRRVVLTEKNWDDYDDGDVVPPGFRPETLRLPFPPGIRPWYESSAQSRTHMNLVPQPEVPSKSYAEIQSELEESFSRIIALKYKVYQVSEKTMGELTTAFEQQKERQERYKRHLRSSCNWQRPPVAAVSGAVINR